MMTNEEERRELMDAIRFLLKTSQEFKTTIVPLIRHEEEAFKTFNSLEKAIALLMDMLVGTQEEHRKMLDNLELL